MNKKILEYFPYNILALVKEKEQWRLYGVNNPHKDRMITIQELEQKVNKKEAKVILRSFYDLSNKYFDASNRFITPKRYIERLAMMALDTKKTLTETATDISYNSTVIGSDLVAAYSFEWKGERYKFEVVSDKSCYLRCHEELIYCHNIFAIMRQLQEWHFDIYGLIAFEKEQFENIQGYIKYIRQAAILGYSDALELLCADNCNNHIDIRYLKHQIYK